MRSSPKVQTFELRIPSDRKNIHTVESFFYSVNETLKISEERLHALLVAVTEAVNNGIIHGNKNDIAKHVIVRCWRRGKALTVKVRDEGEGFVPTDIPSPLQDDNLLRSGGRGIFLMKTFMESIRYNKKGNEVTLRMRIG